jgi:hypothetical protein
MTSIEDNRNAMREQTGPLTGSKDGTRVRSPNSPKPGDKPAPGSKVDHCHPDLKK